jgi:hypothetical protein
MARTRSELRGFLKPSILKIGLTLLVPAITYLIVTSRLDTVMEFYGNLLAPRIAFYDVSLKGVRYLFNGYLLLWIPFYLSACAVVRMASTVRAWPRSEPRARLGA